MTASSVTAVARHCPKLTAFYLERAGRVTDASVKALAEGCKDLAVLDLGWCEVGDVALIALSSSCPLLHTVSLAYCEAVTDDGLDALCRGCIHLASLDIGGCSRLTRLALHSIASHCPRLLSLDLGGDKYIIDDETLLHHAQSCADLRSLNLRFCEMVTPEAIQQVYQLCVNISVRN